MCGIFFLLSGIKPDQLNFNFNPYKYYLNSPYAFRNKIGSIDYLENILKNNLFIPNINL